MSPRARRVTFGIVVIVLGTLALAPAAFAWQGDFVFVAALCELAVLAVGGGLALTAPPASAHAAVPPSPALPATAYRGVVPMAPSAKIRATRVTLVLLASLAFTAGVVPFALHLPRWIETELVVFAWWAILGTVLAFVASRGHAIEDDHRPGGSILDVERPTRWRWSMLLEGLGDPEGCLYLLAILVFVGVALLGAWLVVELVAPAVFLVAYRGVVRALAKARAASASGAPLRAMLTGFGWATVHTAPLAALVALVHFSLG